MAWEGNHGRAYVTEEMKKELEKYAPALASNWQERLKTVDGRPVAEVMTKSKQVAA